MAGKYLLLKTVQNTRVQTSCWHECLCRRQQPHHPGQRNSLGLNADGMASIDEVVRSALGISAGHRKLSPLTLALIAMLPSNLNFDITRRNKCDWGGSIPEPVRLLSPGFQRHFWCDSTLSSAVQQSDLLWSLINRSERHPQKWSLKMIERLGESATVIGQSYILHIVLLTDCLGDSETSQHQQASQQSHIPGHRVPIVNVHSRMRPRPELEVESHAQANSFRLGMACS